MTYTTQREVRVYDDDTGDYVSVGMDGDGLDLVELHQHDDGEDRARIVMKPEQARAFAAAINEYLDAQERQATHATH